VATRVLPGATRDRYREEFLAELYGLVRARQLRHALGVLSRSWALRAAINTPSEATAADMEIVFPRRRRPLSCRLNRHRWATFRTEDSKPYQRCQRCGTDETDIWGATSPVASMTRTRFRVGGVGSSIWAAVSASPHLAPARRRCEPPAHQGEANSMTAGNSRAARRITRGLMAGVMVLLAAACTTTTSGSGPRATTLTPYKGDRFTVSMPGTPAKTTQQAPSPIGPLTFTILTVDQGDRAFLVGYTDFPAGSHYDLNNGARGAAVFMHGQETDLYRLSYHGRPALDARIINAGGGQGTGFLRLVVVDNRLYELVAAVDGPNVKTAPVVYPLMRDSLTF
jgi:hypothetical protein